MLNATLYTSDVAKRETAELNTNGELTKFATLRHRISNLLLSSGSVPECRKLCVDEVIWGNRARSCLRGRSLFGVGPGKRKLCVDEVICGTVPGAGEPREGVDEPRLDEQAHRRWLAKWAIYEDALDRKVWLETLGEACEKAGWRIHAWVMMSNHYHLLRSSHLAEARKGMREKQVLAWWLCQHTTVRRRWVSERLAMGDESRVTQAIRSIKGTRLPAMEGLKKRLGMLLNQTGEFANDEK